MIGVTHKPWWLTGSLWTAQPRQFRVARHGRFQAPLRVGDLSTQLHESYFCRIHNPVERSKIFGELTRFADQNGLHLPTSFAVQEAS
jgi:hypothetical protein